MSDNTKVGLNPVKSLFPPTGALSAKANLMQGFCFVFNIFSVFFYMFSFSLCIYLSFLLSLVLNGTPGVLKLVVVTHHVVLFSLPFSSACFSDRRGRRSPSTIDDLLFCSCTLTPLHQRHYRSACFCLFLSEPLTPKKPHLCADVSERRWSILTSSSFFPASFGKPNERAFVIRKVGLPKCLFLRLR